MKKLFTASLLALAAAGSAQAVVLFNNGPVVGSDGLSVLPATSGTLGAGAQSAASNSVAEDFMVGLGGWMVQGLTFYSYQTGATAFSFTNATWSIVSGDVNTGAVVASGTTTVSNGGLLGYRVSSTATTATNRPIFAAVADVPDFSLAAGAYFLRWSLAGTGASGPWVPPTADAAIGDAYQATTTSSGTYIALTDGVTFTGLNLPFTITGEVSAVPEASTHAMMLLGALGVFAATRRRQAR